MKLSNPLTYLTRNVIAVALGLILATSARAANTSINAMLEPTRITLDEAAQLTVTVNGSQAVEPQLPEVDGLEFMPVGQSSSFQSINGAVTASVSYLFQVAATKAGTFNIPAIRVGNASSKPLQLQVVAGGNGSNARSQSLGRALPPPKVNWPSANTPVESANGQPAFLRVVTPKPELYVGELVPVQIKAYFRRGMSASLNGLPTLSSDAFTMSKLPRQPEQSQEIVDGMAYTVVTWPTTLAPVKAGDYTLNLELPVMVRVQERSAGRPRNPFGSMFDDSFFDSFFGQVSEKPLTLKTDLAAMKVMPLPTAGRPADFSGAVGQFEVHSEATPTSASEGEPVTLKLIISGTGNFDRVTTSGLPDGANMKSYKPSARFEPADSAGLQGNKTFEQAVVPLQSGSIELPAIAFSYFDPEARKYVTQTTQPIALKVAPGNGNPASVSSAPTQSSSTAASVSAATKTDELQPNAVEPGRFVASLQPVLFRPWFPIAIVTPLVLFGCGLWFLKRHDRLAADSSLAQNSASAAALRESLDRMDKASRAGAVTTFFVCARHALQERLALVWRVPPHAVTLAEVNARLNGAGAEISAIFQAADQAAYAGHGAASVDLSRWRQVVHEQLKRMENL